MSKSWDASYSVSFGGEADASVVPPVDASVAAPAPTSAPPDAGPAPPMQGIFHRDEGPDEVNLEIDRDGTFFWRIYGCDFGGGDCGVWSASGTTLVLTPKPPATTMTWDDGTTFTRNVT